VGAILAEWRKALHNKSIWFLAVAGFLVAALVGGHNLLVAQPNMSASLPQRHAVAVADDTLEAAAVVEVFAAMSGILLMTGESSARTWATTLSLVGRRRVVLGAKWTIIVLFCVVLSFLDLAGATVGGIAETIIFPSSNRASPSASVVFAQLPHVTLGIVAAGTLVGAFWTALACLWQHRAGLLGAYLVYAFGVTNAVALTTPDVARWLPEGAAQAITPPVFMLQIGWQTAHGHPVGKAVAFAYLTLVATILFGLSLRRFEKFDITA